MSVLGFPKRISIQIFPMNPMFRPSLLLAFALSLSSISTASDKPTPQVELYDGLEFAQVDGQSLLLDLYLPTPVNNPPLVLGSHGGGWKSGSRKGVKMPWLPSEGYAVASISYRLTDKAIFPAQIHDCKGALRWLRANAEKYGYNADKVVVSGSSAGGHLAALMGTSAEVDSLEGTTGGNLEQSSRGQAVIDFYGATDFVLRSKTQPKRANEESSVVYRLLGGGADKKTELAQLASAAWHVTPDDPPFLVVHGDKDNTVLLAQSERIVEVYEEAHLPIELIIIEGGGHGGKGFFEGSTKDKTLQFLKMHLR